MDAGFIGRRQAAGGGVAGRLDHRAPAPLRNHARDNVMAMRKKMAQMRGKSVIEAEAVRRQPPEFKLKQFEKVKSRLYDLPRPTPNGEAARERPSARGQASGRDKQNRSEEEENIYGNRQEEEEEMDLASFERECERLIQLHGKQPGQEGAQKNVIKKDAVGRPAYLQKIKADLADRARELEEERNPRIPPGYRQMPEHERTQTLAALQKKHEEAEKAFQRLPFIIETDSQRRRQQLILDKIKETDKAIATFSNPMVLIAV